MQVLDFSFDGMRRSSKIILSYVQSLRLVEKVKP